MADLMDPQPKEQTEERLTIDGEFLKEQATEAVETFLAPLAGVVAAASGRRRQIFFRRRRRGSKKAAA